MTFDEYQAWAATTSSVRNVAADTRVVDPPFIDPILDAHAVITEEFVRIDHSACGIASEAGEIMEHVKHIRFHGKHLDREYLIKEYGDLLWYLAEGATGLGIKLSEIAERNVAKLKARYPEGHFTVERSENRKPENE